MNITELPRGKRTYPITNVWSPVGEQALQLISNASIFNCVVQIHKLYKEISRLQQNSSCKHLFTIEGTDITSKGYTIPGIEPATRNSTTTAVETTRLHTYLQNVSVFESVLENSKDVVEIEDISKIVNMPYQYEAREYLKYSSTKKLNLYGTDNRLLLSKVDNLEGNTKGPLVLMPVFSGMQLEYLRGNSEIILHNAPYEGELVKTSKFTEVNREISELLRENIRHIALYESISDARCTESGINRGRTLSSPFEINHLPKFDKFFLNNSALSINERYEIAVYFKQMISQYQSGIGHVLMRSAGDSNYKWNKQAKQFMYYRYGAYTHGEDLDQYFS